MMDLEIKNIIENLQKWRDVKGYRNTLKECVSDMEKLFEKRYNEKKQRLVSKLEDEYKESKRLLNEYFKASENNNEKQVFLVLYSRSQERIYSLEDAIKSFDEDV